MSIQNSKPQRIVWKHWHKNDDCQIVWQTPNTMWSWAVEAFMLPWAFTGSFVLPLKSRHGKTWNKDLIMEVHKETSWVSLWLFKFPSCALCLKHCIHAGFMIAIPEFDWFEVRFLLTEVYKIYKHMLTGIRKGALLFPSHGCGSGGGNSGGSNW